MKLLLCLFTLVLLLAPAATTAEKPILCRGNFHSEADAIKQLARMSAERVSEPAKNNPGGTSGDNSDHMDTIQGTNRGQ